MDTGASIQVVGSIAMVRGLSFPRRLIKFIADTFDASAFRVPAGVITLITGTTGDVSTLNDLASFEENKVGDILICLSMDAGVRRQFINFVEGTPYPPDEERADNILRTYQMCAVVGVTYLLHGSLRGLSFQNPQVPIYALTCTGLTAADFAVINISSVRGFELAKFPKLVEEFFAYANNFPDTLLSRLQLGFAGNRVFSIIRVCGPDLVVAENRYPWLDLLRSETVMDAAPYVSFHPDHPNNPMTNHAKYVYAVIGSCIRRRIPDLQVLANRNPGLFIPGVIAALSRNVNDVSSTPPVLEELQFAVDNQFSWMSI